jgi:protein SCO1/2
MSNNRLQAGTLVILLLLLGAWSSSQIMQRAQPHIPPWLQALGNDFTLQSAAGSVSLHDFDGRLVLLYFGYTHCPDACPMAMSIITGALKSRSAHDAAGVFISLDPRRDTPAVLRDYTAFFHPHLIGLTADPKTLANTAEHWRVIYDVPDASKDDFYSVEHSTFIYLINRHGKVVALFDEKTTAQDILRTMRLW